MVRRIQNKIAESRWALPVTVLYGIAVSVCYGAAEYNIWPEMAAIAAATLLMALLNNENSLIRIYSRMVSSTFLVLTLMLLPLSCQLSIVNSQLSFVVFYLFLLRAYQDPTAVGNIYIAFLAIGLASLAFVHILYLVPLFWLLMAVRLQAFSARTFSSSLLGLLTPYWFLAAYTVAYSKDYTLFLSHFRPLAEFGQPLSTYSLSLHEVLTYGILGLFAITGIIHFLRQRSRDKLRTQILYELFIIVMLFISALAILQPQHLPFLMPLLVVNVAVLLGHFIALTSTKVTNIAFICMVILVLGVTAWNIWAYL